MQHGEEPVDVAVLGGGEERAHRLALRTRRRARRRASAVDEALPPGQPPAGRRPFPAPGSGCSGSVIWQIATVNYRKLVVKLRG